MAHGRRAAAVAAVVASVAAAVVVAGAPRSVAAQGGESVGNAPPPPPSTPPEECAAVRDKDSCTSAGCKWSTLTYGGCGPAGLTMRVAAAELVCTEARFNLDMQLLWAWHLAPIVEKSSVEALAPPVPLKALAPPPPPSAVVKLVSELTASGLVANIKRRGRAAKPLTMAEVQHKVFPNLRPLMAQHGRMLVSLLAALAPGLLATDAAKSPITLPAATANSDDAVARWATDNDACRLTVGSVLATKLATTAALRDAVVAAADAVATALTDAQFKSRYIAYLQLQNTFDKTTGVPAVLTPWIKYSDAATDALMQSKRVQAADLNSLLMSPVQRLARYGILLKAMQKEAQDAGIDASVLADAVERVGAAVSAVNAAVTAPKVDKPGTF